jgi:hypothetical protein
MQKFQNAKLLWEIVMEKNSRALARKH